jgi:hypothetical protein
VRQKLLIACAVFAAVVAAAVLSQRGPGTAVAAPMADKDEVRLRNQVKDLQQDIAKLKRELNEREQTINKLRAELRKENLDDRKGDVAQKMLREKEQLISKLQSDARDAASNLAEFKSTRAVHSAFYRLKPDAPAGAVDGFIADANATLSKVKGVRGLWVGRANPGPGGADFEVALVVLFDDAGDLKQFQGDAVVKRFEAKHEKAWEQTSRDFMRGK